MGEGHDRFGGGLSVLLQEGIGDTVRVSLTPRLAATAPRRCVSRSRSTVARVALVPAAGLGLPSCGRTTSTFFGDGSADPVAPARRDAWLKARYPGVEEMTWRSWAASSTAR
jgi:(E)-4-hydroxy-3-methylbut-2-enyl-diphosphate synthase